MPRVGRILAHLVVQDVTLRDEGRHHRQTKTADHQQHAAPIHDAQQRSDRRRRERKTDIAAESVQGEGAAHALLADRAGKDRVVARVEHGVADTRNQRQSEDLPERSREGHQCDRKRHHQRTADQKRSRAVAVDQESDRGLQHCRGPGHQHDGQTKLREADVELALPHQEQRRQAELIEMRQKMPGADQQIYSCVPWDHEPSLQRAAGSAFILGVAIAAARRREKPAVIMAGTRPCIRRHATRCPRFASSMHDDLATGTTEWPRRTPPIAFHCY